MPDALAQAIGQGNQIQSAATQQVAPTMAAYDLESAKTASADAEKRRALQDKIDQTTAVNAQPIAPLPKAPDLQDIPTTPPKVLPQSPMQTMAQFLPLFAALGGASTKSSAIAALNAGSAAMNAYQASDQAALKQAHEDWKSNMEATLQSNNTLQQEYNNAINDNKLGWDERLAKLAAIATQAGDKLALADLDTGHPENITKRFDMLSKASGQLADVVQGARSMDLKRQELEQNTKVQNAELAIKQTAANAKLTPDVQQVLGEIFEKMRTNVALNDGEQRVLDTYGKWREGGGGGSPWGDTPAGTTITVGPGVQPAPPGATSVPAAPAPGAPAAKVAPALPPVSMLKEGVVTTLNVPASQGGGVQKWTLRGGKQVKVG